MSRLSELPPDQRAVLQLLLQKDRSYAEIAQLLRIDPQTVRARAHDAVASLVPDDHGLSTFEQAQCADLLLGEQTASERAAARSLLDGSPSALAWSHAASVQLAPISGNRLPELPALPPQAPPSVPVYEAPAQEQRPAGRNLSIPDPLPVVPDGARTGRPAPSPGAPAPRQYEEILPPPPVRTRPDEYVVSPPQPPSAASAPSMPSAPSAASVPSAPPGPPSLGAPTTAGTSPLVSSGAKRGIFGKLAWPLTALAISVGLFLGVYGLFRVLGIGGDDDPQQTSGLPAVTQTTPASIPTTPGTTPPLTATTPSTVAAPSATTTPSTSTSTTPSTTPTTSATPTAPGITGEVQLSPPGASGAKGRATASLLTQAGKQSLALAGQGLAPTTSTSFYALWFATSRADAVFLGYTPSVGESGRLRLFDTLAPTADPTLFKQIWLTRQGRAGAGNRIPPRPGKVVLSGDLPR